MELIEIEINKIENFIEKNFKIVKKDSVNNKRLISYAYHLEKIKINLEKINKINNMNFEDKDFAYISIKNEINDLKELIINNSKKR